MEILAIVVTDLVVGRKRIANLLPRSSANGDNHAEIMAIRLI